MHSTDNNITHQICDGYNPKVLMGNWYQQSFAVDQPVRQCFTNYNNNNNNFQSQQSQFRGKTFNDLNTLNSSLKVAREIQVDISFKNSFGQLIPVNRVSRLPPWNTKGLVQNQNATNTNLQNQTKIKGAQNKSVMKQSYDLGTVTNYHKQFKPRPYDKQNDNTFIHYKEVGKNHAQLNKVNNQYQIFNKKNIQELKNQRISDQNSFKSQIKINPHVDTKKIMETMYQQSFLKPSEGISSCSSMCNMKQSANWKLTQLSHLNETFKNRTNCSIPPEWMKNTRNFAQNYKPQYSSTNTYQHQLCYNKLNVKKLANEINNGGTMAKTLGLTRLQGTTSRNAGFFNNTFNDMTNLNLSQQYYKKFGQSNKSHNKDDTNNEKSFKRIRSQITLKNTSSIKTYK